MHDTPKFPLRPNRISKEEKDFIESSQRADQQEDTLAKSEVPWKSILTSRPVWGVAAGHLASNWGNYQLNTLLPTYLSTVLQYVLIHKSTLQMLTNKNSGSLVIADIYL